MELEITLSLEDNHPFMYISAPYEKLGAFFGEIKDEDRINIFRKAIDQIVAGTWSESYPFDYTGGVTAVSISPEISYYHELGKESEEIPTLHLLYLFNIWENFLRICSIIPPLKK
ncbi:hypothetical protein P1X15_01410 [Runella sp. MFBS21]|uniref:hypothetical protein n=1 Tax=Runella sp. MFBS21 TaxID=3034018 RepID=UPI0023F8B88C|nr:hypothetical protein [Runella sp. MFBS21]MDF7816222.1 hypothetical protein [Runella sp. MFBS21]